MPSSTARFRPRSGLRLLARFTLGVLIVAAGWSLLNAVWPEPPLPARQPLADSHGYQLVGFSPDGRLVVGATRRLFTDHESSWIGPVRLWDADAGDVRATLRGEGDVGLCAPRFSADGRHVAVYGPGFLQVWDLATARETFTVSLPGGGGSSADYDFAPDGRTLAAANRGRGAVLLLETATGRELACLVGAYPPLHFAPDGATVATGWGQGVRLWPVSPGRDGRTLPGPALTRLWALRFAPDGRRLAAGLTRAPAGGDEGAEQVHVWDVVRGGEVAVLSTGHPPPRRLLFFAGGSVLAAGDYGRGVTAWDLDEAPPRRLTSFPEPLAGPWGPGGDVVAVRDTEVVRFVDVRSGQGQSVARVPRGHVFAAVAVAATGEALAVQSYLADEDPQAGKRFSGPHFLDPTTGRPLATLAASGVGEFAPDGRAFVAPAKDGGLGRWGVPAPRAAWGALPSAMALAFLAALALGWWACEALWRRIQASGPAGTDGARES